MPNRISERTKLLQITSIVPLAEVKLQEDHRKSGRSCKEKIPLQMFMLCSYVGFLSLLLLLLGLPMSSVLSQEIQTPN